MSGLGGRGGGWIRLGFLEGKSLRLLSGDPSHRLANSSVILLGCNRY